MLGKMCHASWDVFKPGRFSIIASLFLLILSTCPFQCQVLCSAGSAQVPNRQNRRFDFTIRHVLVDNGERANSSLTKYDVYAGKAGYTGKNYYGRPFLRSFRILSRPAQIYRLAGSPSMLFDDRSAKPQARLRDPDAATHEWRIENISEPDISDKETVLSLAKMSSDAYLLDDSVPDWLNFSAGFNLSSNFGWEDNRLRGHVFADSKNSTVVIAIKGTSATPGDDTSDNDKLNDNLLFSCCCASDRTLLGPVCSCQTDTFLCDQGCLTYELRRPDRYYQLALEMYNNVTKMYPGSDIWLTGHSLGGAMGSLLGLTFGRPTVTFEAPPAALPAHRLGLPLPPGALSHQERKHTGIYQFGNTADPIYMGACNGVTSACYWSGYAMDSQCFAGLRCVYDTVGDKGWRLSIISHRINNVIRDVIEAYDEPARCEADIDCVDCYNWYFDNRTTGTFFSQNGS